MSADGPTIHRNRHTRSVPKPQKPLPDAKVAPESLSPRIQAKRNYALLINMAKERKDASLQIPLLLKTLCQTDLFYLLVYGLGRKDLDTDFHFMRCREVQVQPDGMIDLWARAHGKSSIITFGRTIQDILNNPELTACIFSHTKPIARAFLRQIKYELEVNPRLKKLFPEVLYSEPKKESPRWSEDKGITVKRQGNPKEATLEAHGLVDGQPTSRHYDLMVYDDVVTRESVTTPEMIEKVTEAWSLSLNLASNNAVQRYIGTRYHFADTYHTMMHERKIVTPRIYPATKEGTWPGTPALLSMEELEDKYVKMGSFVFAAQMLQDPLAGGDRTFKDAWLMWYNSLDIYGYNIYIVVDPANSKRKDSDYTVMWVIATAPDGNYYLLDGLRDRLNLAERGRALISLHRKWKPLRVGYEEYGMQADIFYIKELQTTENYRFHIEPLGGRLSKEDRIESLVPLFENHKFYLPEHLYYRTVEGKRVNLIKSFLDEEFRCWPVPHHDDMLDCMARIKDEKMGVRFPKEIDEKDKLKDRLEQALLRQGKLDSDIGVTPGGMAA